MNMACQVRRRVTDLTTFPATIFLCLLLCKLAASDSGSSMSSCMSNYTETVNHKTNDKFKANLQTLLTDLTATSATTNFHNATAGAAPHKSYGMYLCRGDVTSTKLCHSCVTNLTQWVASYDGNCTERIAYTDYCMFRYANHSIFGKADDTALGYSFGDAKPSHGYNRTLVAAVERVIARAAYNSSDLFATYETDVVDGHERVYALAQCTPDIGRGGCSGCLKAAKRDVKREIGETKTGWAMLASCQLRYDNASFFNSATLNPAPPPIVAFLVAIWSLFLIINLVKV